MASRNKLLIEGNLGSNNSERWSIGITFYSAAGVYLDTQAKLQTWVNNVRTRIAALPVGHVLPVHLSAAGSVTRVRAYTFGEVGPAFIAAETAGAPILQGSATYRGPFQVARVVTLRTSSQTRSGRGRFYLPALGIQSDSTGRAGVPQQDAAALATLLQALGGDAAPGATLVPGLYSPSVDVVRPLTSLSVGDVLDTQRRRTDKLIESYTSAPL